MHGLSYLLVLGAWLLPIMRVWAIWGKTPPSGHAWLLATCVCFALFSTSVQDGSTTMMAHVFGHGGVYAFSSLACLSMLGAFLRYQRVYQQTTFAAQSRRMTGLKTLHRMLALVWPSAGMAIFSIEGLWMRGWIDAHQLKPFAIVLDQSPLVISRVILFSFLLTGLWVGIVYPFAALVRHRRRLDPAFREQGGHWRLGCLAGTTFISILSGLVHVSATVFGYVQPAWSSMFYVVANTSSSINGPILVIGILVGCLPQRILWSIRSYHLYRRLLPLHEHMRTIITGIYLDVPKPRMWEIILNPVQPIIGLSRLRAEITDARFMCYGEANTVRQPITYASSSTTAQSFVDVARYERRVLDALAQGETCPAEATYLSAIIYQSLDYYLLLAKVLHLQRKNENLVRNTTEGGYG